jgi:hypothetical protein
VGHYQSPSNRPLIKRVLVVILWWQRPTIDRGCFFSAAFAAIDSRIRRSRAGVMDCVERFMSRHLQETRILIESHGRSVPPLSRCGQSILRNFLRRDVMCSDLRVGLAKRRPARNATIPLDFPIAIRPKPLRITVVTTDTRHNGLLLDRRREKSPQFVWVLGCGSYPRRD